MRYISDGRELFSDVLVNSPQRYLFNESLLRTFNHARKKFHGTLSPLRRRCCLRGVAAPRMGPELKGNEVCRYSSEARGIVMTPINN
ncbi:hypothetical protein E2C01_046974 [Portunus trituberculatus]|uniref:Uncharacterized protein n=1 Tax=Portunus trituberculatus TaxID=210409 RepID=A0A5B7FZ64_PORTR|nr:hypothetical protein [Portunus trituberculatus]